MTRKRCSGGLCACEAPWLYIAGLVILVGSEINGLLEDYSGREKGRGEKKEGGQVKEDAEKSRLK